MLFTGSHTGGGTPAQISYLALDHAPDAAHGMAPTTMTVAGTASTGAASYDRHMYANYLGQNPGNQGRNFSASLVVVNPFCADAGTTVCDKLLTLMATTGKDSKEVANVATSPIQDTCFASDDPTQTKPYPCAKLKLSSYLTVIPVAQAGTEPGMGSGSGSGNGGGGGEGGGGDDTSGGDSTTLGGCSAGGAGGAGSAFLLAIGLVGLVRRRR
jgi:uncharacterized protein (TIGR03382 family)